MWKNPRPPRNTVAPSCQKNNPNAISNDRFRSSSHGAAIVASTGLPPSKVSENPDTRSTNTIAARSNANDATQIPFMI